MLPLVYCIKCECMTQPFDSSTSGWGHATVNYTEVGLDIDWCEYTMDWTTCPPPELEDDWEEHLVEPSEEELAQIEFVGDW